MQRSLTGGVTASYHDDFLTDASGCFHGGGGIVDALVFELPVVRDIEALVSSAGGDYDGAGKDRLTPFERKRVSASGRLNIHNIAGDGEACAKFLRLYGSVLCQVVTGYTDRKPKIVLDFRTGGCLPPRGRSLNHHSREPFRSAIHGCGKSSRATAYDRKVIIRMLTHILIESQLVGQQGICRFPEGRAIREKYQRQLV